MTVENEKLEFTNDLLSDMPAPAPPPDPVSEAPELEERISAEPRQQDGDEREPEEDYDQDREPERDAESEQNDAWIEPPARMKPEDQRLFHALPRQAREMIASYSKEKDDRINRATQENAKIKKQYEGLEKVIAPRRAQFQRDNQTPEQVFHTLLELSDYAQKNPRDFIAWFAKENRLEPGEAAAPQQQRWVDPEMKKRDDEIAQLKQQLMGITGRFSQIDQSAHHTRVQQVNGYLDSFREAKDKDGQPTHPYFDEVEQDMALLLEHGRAPGLEEAYDMAVNANPSTRERVLRKRMDAERKEREREARAHADRARRAGSSLPSSASNGAQRRPQKGRSVSQTLGEIWDRQMGENY